jgi:hypothetical protein
VTTGRRLAAFCAALLIASPPSALAETCGDADDSGTITVTDGVRVLRAAAGLDECAANLCDVDGSGSVSVTDGVNVLRAAAGLAVDLRCTVLNAQERQVFGALQKSNQVTRILGVGVDAALDAGDASAAGTAPCPNGGTIDQSGGVVGYADCRVKDTVCSGTATMSGGEFVPALECQDLERGAAFALGGSVTPSETPAGRAITGVANGTQGSSSVFAFEYAALPLAENANGGHAAGQVTVGGAFFAGAFEHVEVSYPGRNPATGEPDDGFAKIVGLRSGGSVIFVFVFDLNLATGKLTPR